MADRFGDIPIQRPKSPSLKKRITKRIPPAPPKKPAKEKTPIPVKIWGLIVGIVVVFALYSSLGFLGVPYYLTEIFPEKFKQKTGMTLEPSSVKFNPLTFRLETKKIRISTESGDPIISLGSFISDLAPLSLLRRDLVSNTLTINQLYLNLARESDGSYNFHNLLGEKKKRNPAEIMDFSDLPFFFSLNNIEIRDSKVTFNDAPSGKTHIIDKIQLDLPTLSNIPFKAQRYLRPRFSAIVNGSPVELSGQTVMGGSDGNTEATSLSCDIRSLELPIYADYLPYELPVVFKSGKADGKIELNFNPDGDNGDKLSVLFELQVSNAEFHNVERSLVVTAPSARLGGKLQPVSRSLVFETITLREPVISSYGESLPKNLDTLFSQKNKEADPPSPATDPFHIAIDLFIVDNGVLRLYKENSSKNQTSAWKSLQLNVKNYNSSTDVQEGLSNGTFRISAERSASPSYIYWQGSFVSPSALTGLLTFTEIDSNELLGLTGKKHPFKLEGVADVKGQFSVDFQKATSSTIEYALVDSQVTIEGFKLIDNEKIVIEAPVVKMDSLNYTENTLNFGDVFIQNGTVQFDYGRLPDSLTAFSSSRYKIQGLDFTGKATLAPLSRGDKNLVLSDISLKANGLDGSENLADKSEPNLSISTKALPSGSFKAQGEVNLAPFGLALKTAFSNLPARNILAFFTEKPLLKGVDGDLSGKGTLSLPQKAFVGELELVNGSIKRKNGSVFAWNKSIFHDFKYTALPFQLSIALADFDQADLNWDIVDKHNGPLHQLGQLFQNIFLASDKKNSKKKGINKPAVKIQELSFSNSNIHIQDQRLIPVWKGEMENLIGKISNIYSSGASNRSHFTFTGQLDDASLSFDGKTNLFSSVENGDLKFILENYPLASFHAQLVPHIDVDTSKGEFDLTLNTSWKDGQQYNSGFLLLTDVESLSKTADSALPLALLKDPDNSFRLPFDYSHRDSDGIQMLFKELLTDFQTLIVKGTLSPLLLATGGFTDLIDNDITEFRPGEFMLSEEGRKVLRRYTAFLIAHPHVGLQLSGGINKKIDEPAIKQQLEITEQKRIESVNKKLFKEWRAQRKTDAKDLINNKMTDDNSAGFTPLQPEPVIIDDDILLELAEKRLNILYQHFTTQLALQGDRISIIPLKKIITDADGSTTGVKITLKAIE